MSRGLRPVGLVTTSISQDISQGSKLMSRIYLLRLSFPKVSQLPCGSACLIMALIHCKFKMTRAYRYCLIALLQDLEGLSAISTRESYYIVHYLNSMHHRIQSLTVYQYSKRISNRADGTSLLLSMKDHL